MAGPNFARPVVPTIQPHAGIAQSVHYGENYAHRNDHFMQGSRDGRHSGSGVGSLIKGLFGKGSAEGDVGGTAAGDAAGTAIEGGAAADAIEAAPEALALL